ncbi:methyltransferase like 21e isoform X2 [Hippocampus zosterae]|uniref:methyltransferase like 21e isoform X2 n=1 Tax=Hippocampus zosterae TaxID=109293 RepID=UPI00223D3AD4|nr:methyltransferase like 21e isoform X2 [Hippocampus zosterae]
MESQQCEESSKTGEEDPAVDKELAKAILARQFHPSVIGPETWEGYIFSGSEIRIKESTDLYGAVLWPSALVLCHFLETNRDKYNLMDKNVIELGAGTGLVSIVSSLLGAKVTSTDLPDVLGNLRYNVTCNTKGRCKYVPLVCDRAGLGPRGGAEVPPAHALFRLHPGCRRGLRAPLFGPAVGHLRPPVSSQHPDPVGHAFPPGPREQLCGSLRGALPPGGTL